MEQRAEIQFGSQVHSGTEDYYLLYIVILAFYLLGNLEELDVCVMFETKPSV